ncbi:MAG: di-trans,poly-cis-decaprenylcistransferase [Spirochaetales bacterium]|nr:di-trans,poly-cis-decaprenylcistransferase [Spirochaetales bacterium]
MRSIPELPVHIGIIMDGNGRWAQRRNTIRSAGHREGLQTAKKIVKAASEIGIKYITLYTFSTENWKRAEDEVNFLMRLISQYLKKEYNFYRDNRIRVLHSGDISLLPKFVQRELQEVIQDTRDFGGIVVNLAINYGGRDEIIRSVNRWLAENHDRSAEGISEHDVKTHLDCPDIPDPDLIIRTGGEQRLSNFLLWESAYSEYYFSDKLWPDFCEEDLLRALEDFSHRTRKYGGAH